MEAKEFLLSIIPELDYREKDVLGISLIMDYIFDHCGSQNRNEILKKLEIEDIHTEIFYKDYNQELLEYIISLYLESQISDCFAKNILFGYRKGIIYSVNNSEWRTVEGERAIEFYWDEKSISSLYTIFSKINKNFNKEIVDEESFTNEIIRLGLTQLTYTLNYGPKYENLFPQNVSDYVLKVVDIYSESDFNFNNIIYKTAKKYKMFLIKHVRITNEKYLEMIDKIAPLYNYLKINNPNLKTKAIKTVQDMVYQGESIYDFIRHNNKIGAKSVLKRINLQTLMECESYLSNFSWTIIRKNNKEWLESLCDEYMQLDNENYDNVSPTIIGYIYGGLSIQNFDKYNNFIYTALYREIRKDLKEIDEGGLNYANTTSLTGENSKNLYHTSYCISGNVTFKKYFHKILKEFFGDISELEYGLIRCARSLYSTQFFEIHKVGDRYKIEITLDKMDRGYKVEASGILIYLVDILQIKLPLNDTDNPIIQGFIKLIEKDDSYYGKALKCLYKSLKGSEE